MWRKLGCSFRDAQIKARGQAEDGEYDKSGCVDAKPEEDGRVQCTQ